MTGAQDIGVIIEAQHLCMMMRGVEKQNSRMKSSAMLGAFQHDPADYDPETYAVTAWEPLRGMRENPHFKEIHRALNAFLAYLER